ncbi:hypothetical protein KY285_035312 [Solanum tuberosum]|nr:hypothetical protein KY285_035312 [Solanum tuberosum]
MPDEAPTLPATVSFAHLSSQVQKDKSVYPNIEELKQHMKKYVDSKFEYLVNLIKANHSEMMNSRNMEDDKQPKDLGGKSTSCIVEVSGKENNNGHQTSTCKFDQQPTLPIQMDYAINDQDIGVSDFDVEDQTEDTLKNHQEMKEVSELQSSDANVHHTAETTKHKKDDPTTQIPQQFFEGTMNEDASYKVQCNTNQSRLTIPVKPVSAVNPQELTNSQSLLSDSQLPTDIPITEIVVRSDTNTPLACIKMPSKICKFPYLTSFGSSEKGKEVMKDVIRSNFPFEGCEITNRAPSYLIDEFIEKPTEDKYRAKATSLGFEMMDYVVAYPSNKKWFYVMSQPKNCWTDQFHWVLAIVELNRRLIRVYNSSISTRKQVHYEEIKKLSRMLPSYLLDSGFFEKNERTIWPELDAYKDKQTGTLLESHIPFNIEYVQGIMQQEDDSMDYGLYVAAFAEFLSDQLVIPPDINGHLANYLRNRYATLLWRYGSDKFKGGYISENDNPPKPKGQFTTPTEQDFVNID